MTALFIGTLSGKELACHCTSVPARAYRSTNDREGTQAFKIGACAIHIIDETHLVDPTHGSVAVAVEEPVTVNIEHDGRLAGGSGLNAHTVQIENDGRGKRHRLAVTEDKPFDA